MNFGLRKFPVVVEFWTWNGENRGSFAIADSQENVMDSANDKSAGENPPDVQAVERSLADLEAASRGLKERIIEEKKRNAMPLDSALGNPEIERQNADGRNDLPDTDED
jgi:hypothetical protein